jgi:outer membrane protein OmpA-like peptidoglycan-associated protein
VREAIAPVQNQVNQTSAHVDSLQKQSDEQKQAIGDLDRQVATADEKAVEAGRKAQEAADLAAKANSAAADAGQRADAANNLAQQAQQNVTRVDAKFDNINNYKLMTTEQVHFAVNRSTLTKEDQAKLDDAIQKLGAMKNYLIEVEGYADRTGDSAYNRELSRKRADAVVHYLAVDHNIPLRVIREIGAGADFPEADNKTREARKENRRVDIKVYTLDLGTAGNTALNSPSAQ